MLCNAMYYDVAKEDVNQWRVGPLVVSGTQLVVGVIINLITIPPLLLVIFLFRKSRRRILRPNRVNLALDKQTEEWEKDGTIEKKVDTTAVVMDSEDPNPPTDGDSGNESEAVADDLSDDEDGADGEDGERPESGKSTGSATSQKEEDENEKAEDADDEEGGKEDDQEAEPDGNDTPEDEVDPVQPPQDVAEEAGDAGAGADGEEECQEGDAEPGSQANSRPATAKSQSESRAQSAKSHISECPADGSRPATAKSEISPEDVDPTIGEFFGIESESRPATTRSRQLAQEDYRPSTGQAIYERVDIERKVVHHKEKFHIHWAFKYIAWAISLLIILIGVFMLWAYAIQFGNDKTYQWLTSSLWCLMAGILLWDPIKLIVISLAVAMVCKNVDLDDDDVDEDEEAAVIADQSLWYRKGLRFMSHELFPIDEEYLEEVREWRKKEMEIWGVLRELFSYAFFIMIIYIISYGNRDPASYRMKQVLYDHFIAKNGFEDIQTSNDWWNWAHATVVDEVMAQPHYNGLPPYGLRGYIGDHTHRIMGYATIRQVRVVPNSCRVDQRIESITQECAKASAFINEDSGDYCNAWEEKNAHTENLISCLRPEFKYVTAGELDSLPYQAKMDLYGGGGYVFRMNQPPPAARKELVTLQQMHWVNNHTRAVFLEFSVYNPQVNLFGISTIAAEFLPGGGIKPYYRFEIVRLLHHHEKAGQFTMVCEVVFAIYIFYYLFKQFLLMKKHGKAYFTTYWTLADWSILILAGVAFFFYVFRYMLTRELLGTFKDTNGNGYMKLQYVGLIDEFYGYSIGLILFVATINFIKMLQFNNRFAILIETLRACWDDLTGFFSVFFIVFFAFVQVFYMMLHAKMFEFHSIIASLSTCFTMCLNKFKFGSIRDTSLTAAIMFFGFAISCSFILINVMLTIIMEAYAEVMEELDERGNKYDIIDFMKHKTAQWFGFEVIPPKITVLRRERNKRDTPNNSENEDSDEEGGESDNVVAELPHKVDAFVNYINSMYCEGEMDGNSKDYLKKSLMEGGTSEEGVACGGQEPRRRVLIGE